MLLSINDVAKRTGLSPHTLRYYERIGLITGIVRNNAGQRLYQVGDLAWLEFLIRLRATHMPIQNMLQFSTLRSKGDTTISERRQLLEHHLQQVHIEFANLQQSIAALQTKIHYYRELEQKTL